MSEQTFQVLADSLELPPSEVLDPPSEPESLLPQAAALKSSAPARPKATRWCLRGEDMGTPGSWVGYPGTRASYAAVRFGAVNTVPARNPRFTRPRTTNPVAGP